MDHIILKPGKLDAELLEKLVFQNVEHRRKEVLVRPGVGEDCATLDFGPYECVMSTDPITAAISDIGRLAVHITCNDIASNGVEPLGIMLAVLLPPGTTAGDVRRIMEQAAEVSRELGVEIIGGHTEITPAVNRPVIVSTAVGRALAGGSQRASGMRPGDLIYMTKYAGLEGCGILASDYESELREVLTEDELAEAKEYLKRVSVLKEGVAAGKVGTSGMHDITEGGVLGAVWELAEIADAGLRLREEAIPVTDIIRKITGHFGIDPLRLISSGSMMIIIHPERAGDLEAALASADVSFAKIGEVRPGEEGRVIVGTDGSERIIDPPGSDELYRIVR